MGHEQPLNVPHSLEAVKKSIFAFFSNPSEKLGPPDALQLFGGRIGYILYTPPQAHFYWFSDFFTASYAVG